MQRENKKQKTDIQRRGMKKIYGWNERRERKIERKRSEKEGMNS